MSLGRQFSLQIDYHQRETRPSVIGGLNFINFGPDWNCNWLTFIQVEGNVLHSWEYDVEWDSGTGTYVTNVVPVTSGEFQATQYCPDGGEQDYTFGGTNYNDSINPRTHIQLNPTTYQTTQLDSIPGYTDTIDHFLTNTLTYPNGSVATFGLVITVSGYPEEKIGLLTKATDPQGHVINDHYSTNSSQILLTQIVDFDGKTNMLLYGNSSFPTVVTEITNTAYGLGVNFKYDSSGNLTNIVDVMGISSSFQYTTTNDVFFTYYTNGLPGDPMTNTVKLLTDLHTPYGETTFNYFHPTWPSFTGNGTNSIIDTSFNGINYAITVTQPDSGKHLFLYCDNTLNFTTIDSDPRYSECSDFDGNWDIYNSQTTYNELYHDNSFYWGPRQYAALSTTVLTNLTSADFQSARIRLWIQEYSVDNGYYLPSQSLLADQNFPPDLAHNIYGLATWYGYQGRSSP